MNILLSSAGRRSYLVEYFKNALNGEGKIYVSNSDPICSSFEVADETVVTPLIYDENYIPFLLDYCQENNIKMLIPLFDIDVMVLSKNRKKFEAIDTFVVTGDCEDITFCNDKYQTYLKLKNENILTPYSSISILEVKKLLTSGILQFPLIVKPRWGMGSIGIYEADNIEELDVFYNKVYRDIQMSYLKYESKKSMNECVLIQKKIDAEEYGLDVINNLHKEYQTTIVKRKLAMRAGETDMAEVVQHTELKNLGKKLANIVKQRGNLDVDVLFDGKNYYVLELNARFGGGYPFSYIAGVDLPLALIKWFRNRDAIFHFRETVGTVGYKDLAVKKIERDLFE